MWDYTLKGLSVDRPTDFMFTVDTYVCAPSTAWGDVLRRAFVASLLSAVAAGVALLLAPWLVLTTVAVLHLTLGLRGWRRAVDSVLETRRQHDAKGGRFAPALPRQRLRGAWVLVLLPAALLMPGVGTLVLVFVAAWSWFALRMAVRRTVQTPASLRRAVDETVWMYAAYPDTSYVTPSGWEGVWTPASTVAARRRVLAWPVASVMLLALLGVGESLLLFGAAPVEFRWVAWLHLATSVVGLSLSKPLLRALLARPLRLLLQRQDRLLPPARTEWEAGVNLLASSTYESGGTLLRDHVLVGYYPPRHTEADYPMRVVTESDCPADMPALVHDGAWHNHLHFTGGTQQGKTTLGVLGLTQQVMCGHVVYETGPDGSPLLGLDGRPVVDHVEHTPILVLDFKGEPVLRATFAEESARLGRVYREFTLEPGKSTAYFNPISNLSITDKTVLAFCEIVCAMLGLFHGLSYGKGYYSRQHRDLLIHAIRAANPKPQTWDEVYRALVDNLDADRHRDVFELLAAVMAISMHPVLGPAPAGVQEINMASAIENNEVIYFCLPATVAAFSIRDVGRMALYCWLDAATRRAGSDRGPKRTLVVMDEAQIICGEEIQTIFQQASAAKITVALSNQSIRDLDTQGVPTMSGVVRDNTRVKQSFSMLDVDEMKRWEQWSGETVGYLRSFNSSSTTTDKGTNWTTGYTDQPVVRPRMHRNLLLQVNDEPRASLLHVASAAGFTRLAGVPCRVRTPYTMSQDDFERRGRTPWPSLPRTDPPELGGLTTVINQVAPGESEARAEQDYAALDILHARLSKLLRPGGPGNGECQ